MITETNEYDSGFLNDYGGGNVAWWHDYIRGEVARCNDFWREQLEQAQEEIEDLEEELRGILR